MSTLTGLVPCAAGKGMRIASTKTMTIKTMTTKFATESWMNPQWM